MSHGAPLGVRTAWYFRFRAARAPDGHCREPRLCRKTGPPQRLRSREAEARCTPKGHWSRRKTLPPGNLRSERLSTITVVTRRSRAFKCDRPANVTGLQMWPAGAGRSRPERRLPERSPAKTLVRDHAPKRGALVGRAASAPSARAGSATAASFGGSKPRPAMAFEGGVGVPRVSAGRAARGSAAVAARRGRRGVCCPWLASYPPLVGRPSFDQV